MGRVSRLAAQTVETVKAIKHFLVRYKAWIMAALAPLGGIWAVLVIAFVDASMFGIPVDPVVAYYIIRDPRQVILLSVMGALGSALGSLVPYLIGYKGGEAVVVKRMGRERFEKVHGLSEKYGDLALIIPALMPPGFPFKLFVLMAGVSEMRYLHFLLSVFVGRLLRFIVLGVLIIAYGPEALSFLANSFTHHRLATLAVSGGIILVTVLAFRLRKLRQVRSEKLREESIA